MKAEEKGGEEKKKREGKRKKEIKLEVAQRRSKTE
jgi:hypothetical protein